MKTFSILHQFRRSFSVGRTNVRSNVGLSCGMIIKGPISRLTHSRAAVLEAIGQPLVIKSMPTVKLKAEDIRVEVHYCAVNPSDSLIRQGLYEAEIMSKLPFVPGFELSGEVIEVGSKVDDLKKGDHVIGLNKESHSAFSEQTVLHYKDAWKIGESFPYEQAAALVDSYATVLIGMRRADIKPEEPVLITAAAGGLGLAAVDIAANLYKAKVLGVCGTEDKGGIVRDKGAFSAVDYHKTEVTKAVKKFTNGKGVNVIFEAVGGDVFNSCFDCIAHEGRIIIGGFASRKIPHILTSQLLPKSCSLIGVSLTHYRLAANKKYRETVEEVIEMYEDEFLEPHISAVFPFDQVNEAFAYLEGEQSMGKVLLNFK